MFEAAIQAGARQAYLIEEPMAAAMGADLPVTEPTGSMVVDIGGGTTEVAVISLGGIVTSSSLRLAGNRLDEAIAVHLRDLLGIKIGERTAEVIKIKIGSILPFEDGRERDMIISGQDMITEQPKEVTIQSEDVRAALQAPIEEDRAPHQGDVQEDQPRPRVGHHPERHPATGGGGLLHGLDRYLTNELEIPVWVSETALTNVVSGCLKVLETPTALRQTLMRLEVGRPTRWPSTSKTKARRSFWRVLFAVLLVISLAQHDRLRPRGRRRAAPSRPGRRRRRGGAGALRGRRGRCRPRRGRRRGGGRRRRRVHPHRAARAGTHQLRRAVAQGEEYRLEAQRLQALLNLKDAYDLEGVGARVIGRSTDAWNQTITIDAGADEGVETGMTVMGPSGVAGQVVAVSPGSSTVRLLSDPASGAAALIQSSRAEGIVRGSLDGLLYLENIGADVTVSVGDVVLTSGLGGSYVRGLLIGTVARVDGAAGDATRRIVVSPDEQQAGPGRGVRREEPGRGRCARRRSVMEKEQHRGRGLGAVIAVLLQVVVAPNIALASALPNPCSPTRSSWPSCGPTAPGPVLAFVLGLVSDLLGSDPWARWRSCSVLIVFTWRTSRCSTTLSYA